MLIKPLWASACVISDICIEDWQSVDGPVVRTTSPTRRKPATFCNYLEQSRNTFNRSLISILDNTQAISRLVLWSLERNGGSRMKHSGVFKGVSNTCNNMRHYKDTDYNHKGRKARARGQNGLQDVAAIPATGGMRLGRDSGGETAPAAYRQASKYSL